MITLGDVKWIFAKSDDLIPNMTVLKENILSSLGTFNETTGKWVAGDELVGIMNNPVVKDRLAMVFSLEGPVTANKVLNAISTETNFSQLFNVH